MSKLIEHAAPRTYGVSASEKRPLLEFIRGALHHAGCRILHEPDPSVAPFRFVFETREGERMGIMVYAFFANSRLTKNRPDDEHRFQVKYGPRDGLLHDIWQDPFRMYTTLFVGIDPEREIFVGADPVLHNPTKHFISIEFKRHHADEIAKRGWLAWERDRKRDSGEPVEILVGGTKETFLRYVRFERDALGEDQGHRALIAEKLSARPYIVRAGLPETKVPIELPRGDRLHELANEFQMSEHEVLTLIEGAPRLKMAVRGWVAEEHLRRTLTAVKGVTECVGRRDEGGPDIGLRFRGKPITVECKNVLRKTTSDGSARIDFQRTRASKTDPCSRYYQADDFDVVAACLHAVTERWEFRYSLPSLLDPHKNCAGRLSNNVVVDKRWSSDPVSVFATVAG